MLQEEAGKPRAGRGPASGVRRCRARASGCDELLNGEIFYTLNEAKIVIEALETALQHHASAFTAGIPTAGA